MNKRAFVTLAALCAVWGGTILAVAQSDRGTITGTITDPSAAVLPGVSIIATRTTNAQTGALTGGFGFINPASISTAPVQPRQGTLVARFIF